jgi:hypothetical protein
VVRATQQAKSGGLQFEAILGEVIMRTYLKKQTKIKRAGGEAQAVERLPSKCQALSSNPSTANRKRKLFHIV